MSGAKGFPDDVVIVGGGFSGLSIAALLAGHGIPVTLLEAADLGFEASTRNQGWLHSGAWFAPRQVDIARMCYESWRKTVHFCPSCLEPGHTGMLFVVTDPDTDVARWTSAWEQAEIPYQQLSTERAAELLPDMDRSSFQTAFQLPDRSIRPHALLRHLADQATAHGARIHTNSRVTKLVRDDGRITSVVTSNGDEVKTSFVVVATGASQADLSHYLVTDNSCTQSLFSRVTLQTHLVAVDPQLCHQPFCLVDCDGFNHMPHWNRDDRTASVFGIDHWKVVNSLESAHSLDAEVSLIQDRVRRFFPQAQLSDQTMRSWSGTTVQAMHVEQIDPGQVPLPTVIDHAKESPCVENLLSVYPGRATLWTHLAEDAYATIVRRLEPSRSLTARPPWA